MKISVDDIEKHNEELEALKNYVRDSAPKVNKLLRRGEVPVDGLFDGLIKTMDKPKILFRWLPNRFMHVIDKNRYQDKAYYSCSNSFDAFIGRVDGNNLACLKIKTGDSFQGVNVNELLHDYNDEGEFIVPHGHAFRVNQSTVYTDNEFDKLLLKEGSNERPNTLTDVFHIKSITVYEMEY